MKLKYTFLTGILAAAAMSSCVNEAVESEPAVADSGKMALTVSIEKPQATRANTQVYDFPVIVKDAQGQVVKSYERADAVPTAVILAVGNYTVESHTPGELSKKMTAPYYGGSADMEIKKDLTTNVNVICKMLNSSIQMKYDADFLNLFATWSITVDDGSETALSFTNESSSEAIYWYFENATDNLTLQFQGVTKQGNTVTATRQLSKNDDAVQQYGDDNENFSGGDVVVINFSPVESTSGTVEGITINANVTFAENAEVVIPIDVTDANLTPGGGDDPTPGGGDDPTPANVITLNLPNNMTVSAATDKSLGDTYIKCDNGIKSIKVSIVSTSDEMIESLSELNDNYEVDFVAGAEIVGNDNVVQLFEDLNQPLSVPAQGDIDYTFPIGNFFGLLAFLPGAHTFNMVVEDMNGNKKNGSLTLTVE